ncbi:MAG: Sec-independent protein translocase subunit TatA, partial [Tomitella sp.]|nr:Sec-independent protein translocase subunit TatA [Tomitella sp.]
MGAMSPWHWAIVLVVLVLLFGSTRLPGAARGLGRSLRIFKSEMREMTGGDKESDPDSDSPNASAQSASAAQPPQQQ